MCAISSMDRLWRAVKTPIPLDGTKAFPVLLLLLRRYDNAHHATMCLNVRSVHRAMSLNAQLTAQSLAYYLHAGDRKLITRWNKDRFRSMQKHDSFHFEHNWNINHAARMSTVYLFDLLRDLEILLSKSAFNVQWTLSSAFLYSWLWSVT